MPSGQKARLAPRSKIWLAAAACAAIIVIAGAAFTVFSERHTARGKPALTAAFVGSEACAGCHQGEAQLWRSSQHNQAMSHATEATVLGDFSGASFTYHEVQSRFFREGGKFLIETDGPDGTLAVFEIKYTFGIEPLQQYLIAFPDGRLQALSIAWDSRPKDIGGQRWFHLYPGENVRHDDILHWTKLNQNWNFMCAECHSTGLRKNYDAAADRFSTVWAEISVGCEACHGEGSNHLAWARGRQSWWPFGKVDDPAKGLAERFSERRDVTWALDANSGNATRTGTPRTLRAEVETCGRCHARRGQLSETWTPGRSLSQTHMVAPLGRGLYHADGQMLDEVYNYGSFKQSKMFAAGVTCSDCHDPHSAKLRMPGDETCLQCHASEKYAAEPHHRHEAAAPPLACASCHMPVRTYMGVDARHDHGFRVPRPDLSAKLATPNACNDCHADKSSDWAASAIERWHGPARKGFQSYAEAFHAAWNGHSDAATQLAAVAADGASPAFARAGALAELRSHPSPETINLASKAVADPDPMVRIAGLDLLQGVPAARAWPIASPLLSDPVSGVRMQAASLLGAIPAESQPPTDRDRFERAAAAFVAAQRLNADRPEARSTLGNFLTRRGRPSEAEAEYKTALRLSTQYAPAAINLADLYRQLGREAEGEHVLSTALAASPRDAGLHHALGLTLIRLTRPGQALTALRAAAELEPDRARYAYVYAIALHSAGRAGDAIPVLTQSLARHPRDRDTIAALMSFHRDAGEVDAALTYAERLATLLPQDQDLARLIRDMRQRGGTRTPE